MQFRAAKLLVTLRFMKMQRHFLHVKVEQDAVCALLPVVLILQTEDIAILNDRIEEVKKDLMWILELHAGSILPLTGSSSAPSYGITPLDPKTGTKRVYHDVADRYDEWPVASYRLHAHIRHKESETARRLAAAKPTETLDTYVVSGESAAASVSGTKRKAVP